MRALSRRLFRKIWSNDCPSPQNLVTRRDRRERTRLDVTQLEDRTLPGFLASVDLSASSDSTMVDEPETLTAVVAQVDGYTATGTVYFYENGATLIGSATLDDGTATLSTSFATNGDPSITADYAGDSNFDSGNSFSQNISVSMASTTTAA